jgi:magnesium transporter
MSQKPDPILPSEGQTDVRTTSLKSLVTDAQTQASSDMGLPELNTPEQIEDFALSEDYLLNPQYIELVVDAADRGDGLRLRELLDALHPADVADLMGFLSADYREIVIPWIPSDALADILPELDDGIREEVIETPLRLMTWPKCYKS